MEQHSSFGTGTKASSAQGSASSRATVVLTAVVAALGGLLFGFDTSVISGAMLFLRTDFHLSDVQLEFAVGIALAGALVGSALAGYCTDRWGRRWMLLVTALGFGLFSVLSGLAVGLVSFSVARFFVGACIGIASLTVPLYIAEMAPARIRGALVSLNQLAITVGIGVAYFVDYAFAASENWRWMFASAVLPAIVLLIGMIFLPESPRWLARKGFRDRALENFRRLGRGEEAEAELAEVEGALQEEQEGFGILLQPGFRVAVLVGIGLAIFQQITGINTIIYYSPAILRMSGYPSAKAAILAAAIIGVANVLITMVSMALVDRLGRRFLLLLSTAGMAVALALIGRRVLPEGCEHRGVLRGHRLRRFLWHRPGPGHVAADLGDLPHQNSRQSHVAGDALGLGSKLGRGGNLLIAPPPRRAGENILALRLHLCGGLHFLLRLRSGDQGPHPGSD